MNTFFLLLAGHALGDFVFQTAKSVDAKKRLGWRAGRFWLHALGHGLLTAIALLLAGMGGEVVLAGSAAIAVVHGAIDAAKLAVDRRLETDSLWRFRTYVLDQTLHAASLFALAQWLEPWPIPAPLYGAGLLALALLATLGIGHGIDLYLARFQLGTLDDEQGLNGAGFHIGLLERLLVVGFVVMDLPAGVGFLLAAKSIFRFGDLQRAESRALTEYVLMGTLLSIGGAFLLASLFKTWAESLL